MYTPAHFRQNDRAALLAFMQQYTFAALVTAGPDGAPVATHLPFVVEQQDETIRLIAHMARANRQWEHFGAGEALVIFQEPHAYISPRWYDKELSVPTWNYVAVHAYGRVQLWETEEAVFSALEKLIMASEPAYLTQWERLPEGYKTGLAKGVVAFEMEVTRLEGKEKLSQNRTEKEIGQIMEGLQHSGFPGDQEIAAIMHKKYGK